LPEIGTKCARVSGLPEIGTKCARVSGLPEIGTKCARVKIAKINRFAPSHDGGESEPLLAAVGIGSQSTMK